LRNLWRSVFDVREGEFIRTTFMTLYLFFVLFAYYILKPVSRALFLSKFDIDKLPHLYVLIACVGGFLAYLYTKVAVRTSLQRALTWTTSLAIVCLVAIWWVLQFKLPWMLYVFNVWVSLFSIVLVSQGWLIAANVFSAREAKRLYGILGLGAVIGAAFGGSFTAWMTRHMEPRGILLASAGLVALSYFAFQVVLRQKGVNLSGAKAAEAEEADFQFADIVKAIGSNRHLQVIMSIITMTFIVDVLVEFQFSAMAKAAYSTEASLTAFLGSFYGIYLNLITFVLQFFLTTFVVGRFGVGGTLQIMPVAISATSMFTLLAPGLWSTACVRLTEAATRYSFNKTGMELLYLPLPTELKNRTKAFVDIFVDRFGRGLGAVTLLIFE
jgi:AAA family ATP:ADP antiporter